MQNSLVETLSNYWKVDKFRPLQKEICASFINGDDILALLPTGGGKSLCYQLPAVLLEGTTLVVSPLISLMEDQVYQANVKGIKSMYLNNHQTLEKQLDNIAFGKYSLVYCSPEKLNNPLFTQQLQRFTITRIAIDEAHCISQWGNDFRPAYKKLSRLRQLLPSTPIIALTATATPKVVNDIINDLALSSPQIYKSSFERANIAIDIQHTTDKRGALIRAHSSLSKPSIIYCASRKETEEIATLLNAKHISASFFHGGLSSQEKKSRLLEWQNEQKKVMVATNAFGMGIDKANVELVSHLNLPASLEHYYQEIGRAGRDGLPARALLLIHPGDHTRGVQQYLEQLPDANFISLCYKHLCNFLSIALGEGNDQKWFFSFHEFCQTYKLPPKKTDRCLTLFDQAGIFQRKNISQHQARFQFLCSQKEFIRLLEKATYKTALIFQLIARKYSAAFDQVVPIDLDWLGQQSQLPFREIITEFNQAKKFKTIDFSYAQADIELTGLLPREDRYTTRNLRGQIKKLNQIKKEKFTAMLSYTEQNNQCKQKILLAYFGEEKEENCNQCSALSCCETNSSELNKETQIALLKIIRASPVSLQQIKLVIPSISEAKLVEIIEHLLEQKTIERDSLGQFYIK